MRNRYHIGPVNFIQIVLVMAICFSSAKGKSNVLSFNGQGHIHGQEQGNPYSIEQDGETFIFTVSNGAGPIVTNHIYKTSDNSCIPPIAVDHMTPGVSPATTWTIQVESGNEIALQNIVFDNIWVCFPDFHYELAITGWKDGEEVASDSITIDTIGVEFVPGAGFDNVDEVVIYCYSQGGLTLLGMQEFGWISQVTQRPQIQVSRGGMTVSNGDQYPTLSKKTKLTSLCGRFSITNVGGKDLILTNGSEYVQVTEGAEHCRIASQPESDTLDEGQALSFVVEFDSLAPEGQLATIQIVSNDCLTPVFTFATEKGNDGSTCLAPVIQILGNNVVIANGDSTPSSQDGTDFGGTATKITRVFHLRNNAEFGTLELTGMEPVTLADADASCFEVSKQPDAFISEGETVLFEISYSANDVKSVFDKVIIQTNDMEQLLFEFSIQANAFPINVFNFVSPDGDGENDVFLIGNIEEHPNQVTVIDQLGMVVLDEEDYQNDWSPGDLPNGTYFYTVQLFDTGEKLTGGLLLKR